MGELVADELRRLGATDAQGPVLIQSFDAAVLRELRTRLGEAGPQLVQLIDNFAEGDRMVSPSGLREISTYAQAIAPSVERVLGGRPVVGGSALVEEAHRAALAVFTWTLRAENAFLPEHLRLGDVPEALGDAVGVARQLLALGVDGLITDSPDHAVRAVQEAVRNDMAALRAAPRPGAIPQPR
jgi:glycerophosphoryl diester phosphodiesterase